VIDMTQYLKGRAIIYGLECAYSNSKRYVKEDSDWKSHRVKTMKYVLEHWDKVTSEIKASQSGSSYYLEDVHVVSKGISASIEICNATEIIVPWSEIKKYLSDGFKITESRKPGEQITILDLFNGIFENLKLTN